MRQNHAAQGPHSCIARGCECSSKLSRRAQPAGKCHRQHTQAPSALQLPHAVYAMQANSVPIADLPPAEQEAIAAGIDTLIFVTGRNKRAIEDHFDNNKELEMALRAKGKKLQADMIKNILPPQPHSFHWDSVTTPFQYFVRLFSNAIYSQYIIQLLRLGWI